MNPRLQAVYDQVPEIRCQRKCGGACTMIPLHPIEVEEIRKFTGHKVKVHTPDWGMTYKNFVVLRTRAGTVQCRYFRRNGCRIYEVRPLICRLYGVAEDMTCAHGCKPERILSKEEAHALILQVELLEIQSA